MTTDRQVIQINNKYVKPSRGRWPVFIVVLVCTWLIGPVSVVSAQETRTLLRVLNRGGDFRARAQAAFALGNLRSERSVPSLVRSLRDRHPAVRAAAATALGRIGNPRAAAALVEARGDSSHSVRVQADQALGRINANTVPSGTRRRGNSPSTGVYPAISVIPSANRIAWPRVRYVITIGELENSSGFRGSDLTSSFQRELRRQLQVLRGVAVFSSPEALDRRAQQEIHERQLPQLQLNARIARVRRSRRGGDLSIRCEVALMLLEQGSIRGELRGAATGSAPHRRNQRGEQEAALAERALSGAIRSAMTNAREAIREVVNQ